MRTKISFIVILVSLFAISENSFGQWLDNNGNTYTSPIGNNVGIGTENPNQKLHINGTNPTIRLTDENSTINWDIENSSSSLNFKSGSGIETVFSISDLGNVYSKGNIGIGTNNPKKALHIKRIVTEGSLPATLRLENQYVGKTSTPPGPSPSTGLRGWDIISDMYSLIFSPFGMNIETIQFSNTGQISSKSLLVNYIENIWGGNAPLHIKNGDTELFKVDSDGFVYARELIVQANGAYVHPDYVFDSNYKPISLKKLEKYIKENKHLPEVPSAKEVAKNGLKIGEMNTLLLKKVEELTLYIIEQNKRIEKLEEAVKVD